MHQQCSVFSHFCVNVAFAYENRVDIDAANPKHVAPAWVVDFIEAVVFSEGQLDENLRHVAAGASQEVMGREELGDVDLGWIGRPLKIHSEINTKDAVWHRVSRQNAATS